MDEGHTQILASVADGDREAANRLWPSVYDELRRLAQSYLARESPHQSLQATALVHEAYLKLIDQRRARWQDQAHFCALAAQAMRRILIDHARTRKRLKRGGATAPVSLETQLLVAIEPEVDLLALDDALRVLAEVNAEAARITELRYFGGLTVDQTAEVLGVSDSTVEREWRYARAWLFRELGEAATRPGEGGDGE